MKKLNSREIKIGILTDIKKQIVVGDNASEKMISFKIASDLRGIIYTKNDDDEKIVNDILYPTLQYEIVDNFSTCPPGIRVTKEESLEELLDYCGYGIFTYNELQKFIGDILLNKRWFYENMHLFALERKKYGPISIQYSPFESKAKFSPSLGKIISQIQAENGFMLSKKEKNNYKPRKY